MIELGDGIVRWSLTCTQADFDSDCHFYILVWFIYEENGND